MNHVPSHILSEGARPLTRRAVAKLRTRQALLAAGKQLFTERGYEQATVRDIARAAGMSTGAVFANFLDKSDLFGEIMTNDYERLAADMRAVASETDLPTRQALVAVLSVGYAFHLDQLPLLQAAIAVSWSHTPEEEKRTRSGLAGIVNVVRGVLARGVERKELRADADIDLLADLVFTAYRSNFRLAAYDGYDIAALTERLDRQVQVLLCAVKS